MKAKDLIERLKDLDPEKDVVIVCEDNPLEDYQVNNVYRTSLEYDDGSGVIYVIKDQ